MHAVSRLPAPGPVPKPGFTLPAHPSPKRPTLLLVDDDAGVREALHLILDSEYEVLDAAHGRTALRVVSAYHVDLVLLDILMPDVDGIEILQELSTVKPDLPVIMMTAVKTARTIVAAMKLGAVDYVTKPFQEEELVATIRRALAQHASFPPAHTNCTRQERETRLPRTHRLLLVGGELGWRATMAVALARFGTVETSTTLVEGLNRVLMFRPTFVVLNLGESAAEAARFVGALHAQVPASPVFIVSDDAYLDTQAWEALNIRGIMRPPVDPGELIRRIRVVVAAGDEAGGPWPQLGASVSRAIVHLGTHFGKDLTVNSVAQSLGISASHLAHLFRFEMGMSVRNYLTRVRVAVAQDFLAHTDEKLESIAAHVGFVDRSHLGRVFRKVTRTSPAAYRRAAS